MKVSPINTRNAYKAFINSEKLGSRIAVRIPVSFNPVKNSANKALKTTVILSNRFQLPVDENLKEYVTPITIPHEKNNTETFAWEMKKSDTKKYVIIMHGLSHNITNLQDLYKGILKNTDYTILAPEYTDICKPHENRKVFSTKTIVDDSKAIMNYLDNKGIERKDIVVAGHSFGGYIATLFAKEFPDIGKLLLISPTDSLDYQIYNIENGKNSLISNFARFVVKNFRLAKWQLSRLYKTRKPLSKVQCPVDIIHAKRDNLVKPSTAQRLADTCQNLHGIHILDEGSHRMDKAKINAVIDILNNK